jgi:hypothetical protein
MPSHEIYLKNIVRRWKKEVQDAAEVLIFSPYVTSSTAETVCRVIPEGACRIYTQFTFFLFVNQSSSIKTLRKLKEAGHRIFMLENLHAKMVIVPGCFASVGSQNLTNRGASNLEASVTLTEQADVEKVLREARAWSENAREISLDMILDMQRLVAPYEKEFVRIVKEADGIDAEVEAEEAEREEKRKAAEIEERRRLEKEQEQKRTFELLKQKTHAVIETIPKSKEIIFCKFDHRTTFDDDWEEKNYYGMLCPVDKDSKLTKWKIDGNPVQIERAKLYFCILNETCKIGWVRVCDSRISFCYQRALSHALCKLGHYRFSVYFQGVWPVDEANQINLKVIFKARFQDFVFVEGWFGIDGFRVKKVSKNIEAESDRLEDAFDWVQQNITHVEKFVAENVTGPFGWKMNRKDRVSGYKFFEGNVRVRRRINLRLCRLHETPFLLSKRTDF